LASQDYVNCSGNTPVHVAAAPQIVLLYKFVCVVPARQRRHNTHKLVVQLLVAAGDLPVRGGYCHYSLIDILPSPEGGRDAHLRKWDLPGSLKSALHGAMRVWSHMLLPQA